MRLVEGWTADIDLTVTKADGTAFPWAGCTVVLILKDRDGGIAPAASSLPQDGTLRWSPAATDMVAAKSPYYLHAKITKSGKDSFVPQGPGLQITVTAQGRP